MFPHIAEPVLEGTSHLPQCHGVSLFQNFDIADDTMLGSFLCFRHWLDWCISHEVWGESGMNDCHPKGVFGEAQKATEQLHSGSIPGLTIVLLIGAALEGLMINLHPPMEHGQ